MRNPQEPEILVEEQPREPAPSTGAPPAYNPFATPRLVLDEPPAPPDLLGPAIHAIYTAAEAEVVRAEESRKADEWNAQLGRLLDAMGRPERKP